MAVVIAANRTRHPLDARTLARLAAQYVDRGVVGFGLSNDERRGTTADFAPAFAIAERAGLLLAPHGGELRGPEHIRTCLDDLHADRLGHGVRAAEDPDLLARIVDAGVAARGVPGLQRRARRLHRPHLGAAARRCSRPARRSRSAPTTRCSSAPGWPAQYATMRAAHDLSDAELAELARMSVRARPRPTTSGPGCSPTSTTGWPDHLS